MSRLHPAALLLAAALLGACRSHGDFRCIYEPDPVPRCARTGMAFFRLRVDSLADRSLRIGRDGPRLEAGGSTWIDVDLPPDTDRVTIDLYPETGGSEPVARLSEHIRCAPSELSAEASLPLPKLAGQAPRIVAGFHASHHRTRGRRRALDLVPREGEALGAAIASPIAGRVLGVSAELPDIPGGRPNEILIRADDGRILLFSHLMRGSCDWRPGERVEVGETLGRIGMSGRTSGPHLHLELVSTRKRARNRAEGRSWRER